MPSVATSRQEDATHSCIGSGCESNGADTLAVLALLAAFSKKAEVTFLLETDYISIS